MPVVFGKSGCRFNDQPYRPCPSLPDNRFTRGKCGFKALQYAAAGLPAVASPVGVNAEYVIDGATGYHASQFSQWVNRLSELIGDVRLRKQEAGFEARYANVKSPVTTVPYWDNSGGSP